MEVVLYITDSATSLRIHPVESVKVCSEGLWNRKARNAAVGRDRNKCEGRCSVRCFEADGVGG